MRPARSTSRASCLRELSRQWRCLDAGRPHHGAGGDALGAAVRVDVDPAGINIGHPCVHPEFDAEMSELTCGGGGELVAERRQRLLTPVEEQHAH